jgi:HlyD family secretion protein
MKTLVPLGSVFLAFLVACNSGNDALVSATGTLEATEIRVSSQVSGVVWDVRIEEGSRVAAGDTIAVIDSTDWNYQWRQAEANLRATEAQLRLAIEGPRQEDLRQAEAAYENAHNDLRRMEELYRSRTITEKQFEDARTRYTVAEQTLEKLRKGSRSEELQLARARRDQAAAQAASMHKKLEDCVLLAPARGTMINRLVEPGEFVGPGTAVAVLADLESLELKVYVPEKTVPKLRLGMGAEIRIDAFEDRSFPGKVVYISPQAEFTPKNIQTKEERTKLVFAVKIAVANPDGILKSGIPADVTLRVDQDVP